MLRSRRTDESGLQRVQGARGGALFASMPTDQRRVVFERLGLPNDMLNRIPPPTAQGMGEVEVEWKEWDAAKSA